jgi:hypothetical protein
MLNFYETDVREIECHDVEIENENKNKNDNNNNINKNDDTLDFKWTKESFFVEDRVIETPSFSLAGSSLSSSGDMEIEESSETESESCWHGSSPDEGSNSLRTVSNLTIEENAIARSSFLYLGMDLIQTMFEHFILLYATDSDLKDKTSVFFKSFKSMMVFAKMTSKRLNERTNNKDFWVSLHMACYNQRRHLGSHFKEVSFKTTYVEHVSELSQEKLCANLFDMVLGDTNDLKRKRELAVELSVRNALQMSKRYVDVVFYKINPNSDTLYVRRATPADPPFNVQYLVQEEYDVLMLAMREVEIRSRLEYYCNQKPVENAIDGRPTAITISIATK